MAPPNNLSQVGEEVSFQRKKLFENLNGHSEIWKNKSKMIKRKLLLKLKC